MSGYFEKPAHWRMRAEMTRTIAEGMPSGEARDILLGIVKDYERMALRMEQEATQERRAQRRNAREPVSPVDASLQDRIVALKQKWQGGA